MKKLAKAYMASGLLCCIGIAPFSGELMARGFLWEAVPLALCLAMFLIGDGLWGKYSRPTDRSGEE